jgi:nitrogen regulatory protein P-II 1
MVKIEALIQPFKLEDVKAALAPLGIGSIMISEVFECGGPAPVTGMYRGHAYRLDLPKVKLEILTSSLLIDDVVDAVTRAARTNGPGDDGMILVHEVADAIRIRSGARAAFACL